MTSRPTSDDETTDQVGKTIVALDDASAPAGHASWDDNESTEVVSNADVGGFFGGRFRIDARLGAGAMGRVLTALDTETGNLVALKVLHRERSKDKNVLRRFAREAAALRAINHRAIVGIVASGRAPDGTPWLAMEHLTGQTLKARIHKGGPLAPAQLWPILKTLCEAVAEAHARGVVHRDLKPDNIFLPEGGEPVCKILDFGLSTLSREGADKVTATGQLLGTPRYMAPELLASVGKPDHRVDVFALAVVTFEALTGRSLYSAEDLGSLFGQILEARTHSLRQFRPDLSADLETVIRKGHARSMSDRYESAGAFAVAFAAAAGIQERIAQPQAALASLFDDAVESDGNAPLVDPFGAPAKLPTGAHPVSLLGGPLPPMAHEVPPLIPTPPGPAVRQRVSTRQGVGGDLPPGAWPAPSVRPGVGTGNNPLHPIAPARPGVGTGNNPLPQASPNASHEARTAPASAASGRGSGSQPLPGYGPVGAPRPQGGAAQTIFGVAPPAPVAGVVMVGSHTPGGSLSEARHTDPHFGQAYAPSGPAVPAPAFNAPAGHAFNAPAPGHGYAPPPPGAAGHAPVGHAFNAPAGHGYAPPAPGEPFPAPAASHAFAVSASSAFAAPAPTPAFNASSGAPAFNASASSPGAPAFNASASSPGAPAFNASASSPGAPAFVPPAQPAFSSPGAEPRFTAPPAGPAESAAATKNAAPEPRGSGFLYGALFTLAAIVVVIVAVAGAIALRWWMSHGGF